MTHFVRKYQGIVLLVFLGFAGFPWPGGTGLPAVEGAPPLPSSCEKALAAEARGSGPVPYNFRRIDQTLCAGGSLFHPETHANRPEQVRTLLQFLKGKGVRTIISLHVPAGHDPELAILGRLCREEGLDLVKVRMNSETVPTPAQTRAMQAAIRRGAYVHCQWGCDRTGAVIARYLRDVCGWTGSDAWRAVITGGSHAGPIGGLKQKPGYRNLIRYFWPEVGSESPEVCRLYDLPVRGSHGASDPMPAGVASQSLSAGSPR